MKIIPENVQKLIDEFSKLPGIGPKTAQRLAFYLLRSSENKLTDFGMAITSLKSGINPCNVCFSIANGEKCIVCGDPSRDPSLVCVVEEPLDIVAIEKTGKFSGLYHVLGGTISPIDGIGPDELYIKELVDRASHGEIREVILATNPSIEGEATALYIQKLIKPLGVKITRITRGLPMGSDIEYADEITITRALEGRLDY